MSKLAFWKSSPDPQTKYRIYVKGGGISTTVPGTGEGGIDQSDTAKKIPWACSSTSSSDPLCVAGERQSGEPLIVDTGDTRLLDCGFDAGDRRAAGPSRGAAVVDALLLTHSCSDHIAGAFRFARRFGVPVHLSPALLVPRDSAA